VAWNVLGKRRRRIPAEWAHPPHTDVGAQTDELVHPSTIASSAGFRRTRAVTSKASLVGSPLDAFRDNRLG